MIRHIRYAFAGTLALSLQFGVQPVAAQDDYPSDTIQMFISAGAGGSTDAGGRILAKALEESLGTSIVVLNKPGGSGSRALIDLLKEDPDGYSIAYVYSPHVSFAPQFRRDTPPYTVADFDYLGSVTNPRYSVVGPTGQDWTGLDGLMDSLKAEGRPLRFVYSAGPGRLVGEAIGEHFEVPVEIVRAQSGGESMQLILGGHVDVAFSGGTHTQYTNAGEMQVLATADAERDPNYPDSITLEEYGVDATAPARQILVAPKGLPEDVKERLRTAVESAKEDAEIRDLYENSLSMPIDTVSANEMDAYMADEERKYRSLITNFDAE